VLVDGAQAISHMRVDVQSLDCDFYVLSGHKLFAPTGIGVVYGKSAILDATRPWQGGGNMIQDVTFEKTIYNVPPPVRGRTGSLGDAVGLGAAIDYLDRAGMENIARREIELLHYGTAALATVPACASSARREKRWASSPSCWKASARRKSAIFSTGKALPCARGIIARNPYIGASASRARCARRWHSTTLAGT